MSSIESVLTKAQKSAVEKDFRETTLKFVHEEIRIEARKMARKFVKANSKDVEAKVKVKFAKGLSEMTDDLTKEMLKHCYLDLANYY